MLVWNRSVRTLFAVLFFFFSGFCFFAVTVASSPVVAQENTEELTPEELKEKRILERYFMILEKNPRRGTAFDRVYGTHVEQGTLNDLVAKYTALVKAEPNNGVAWKILGMIEANRGRDAEAVEAYQQAEKLLEKDASVSYYLGQSYILLGQPESAVTAFENAIARKPAPNELLDVYQALGKVYQRLQKTEEALAVWSRLDKQFPNNQRVQEQIAITLLDEADFTGAKQRYEKMSKQTKDDYRKVVYKIKVAELKLKMGEKSEAVADFESMMTELNPTSWLYRQVRDAIEETFRKNDDLSGLTAYYEAWVKKNPRDVDSMARLSHVLFQQERDPESLKWLRKAIELAPTNTAFRLTLIEHLIQNRKNAEAIKEYAALDKIEPHNTDTLRDWGFLHLLDKSKPKEERQAAAAKIWNRLLNDRADDPVIVSQIADWFREAEAEDRAIELYKTAIKLAPENVQYREYLGEYYHRLERKKEALATWKELVTGENNTPRHLIRLAEVLRGFGYREEGLEYMRQACEQDVEYADRLNYANMLLDSEQHEEALKQLALTEALAENNEERYNLLQARIKCYQVSKTLKEKIEELTKELKAEKNQTAEKWSLLAMYQEADGNADAAYEAIKKALENESADTLVLLSAGRIFETAGDLTRAVTVQQMLLKRDRKSRPTYLKNLAQLEMQNGNTDIALQYGEDLIAASPGNVEGYLFYASLCFQLGNEEDAFKALRRAVRVNPNDLDTLMTLAGALGRHYKTDDAIELYWRAYEKTDDLDGQLQVVQQMTLLYQRMGKFEKLEERFKAKQRNREQKREITLGLAHAYKTVHNYGSARTELQTLLGDEQKDTQLLTELVNVAEAENDLDLALTYMETLNEIAPNEGNKMRLINLKVATGKLDEVEYALSTLLVDSPPVAEIHKITDTFMARKKFDAVLKVLEKTLPHHPDNWELRLKEAITLSLLDKKEEAEKKYDEFLKLNIPEASASEAHKLQMKRHKQTLAQMGRADEYRDYTTFRRFSIAQNAETYLANFLKQYQQNQNQTYGTTIIYGGGYRSVNRSPFGNQFPTFGYAKLLLMGYQYAQLTNDEEKEKYLKKYDEQFQKKPNDFQSQWNRLCLLMIKKDLVAALEYAGKRLKQPEIEYAQACMHLIHQLSPPNNQRAPLIALGATRSTSVNTHLANAKEKRLTDKQLEIMLAAHEVFKKKVGDVGVHYTQQIVAQLLKHDREVQANALYAKMFSEADTPQEFTSLLQFASQKQDYENYIKVLNRIQKNVKQDPQNQLWQNLSYASLQSLGKMGLKLEEAEEYDKLQTMFDVHLNLFDALKVTFQNQHRHSSRMQSLFQQNSMHVQVWTSLNQTQHREIKYPLGNSILTQLAIQHFYNFYHFYQKAGETEQLIEHLEKRVEQASEEQKVYFKMVLSAFYWWDNSPEQAVQELSTALEKLPGVNYEMRRELIKLYLARDMHEEALAELDKEEPKDRNLLKQREWTVLQIAPQLGEEERAQLAAERLFTMRLDFNSQMQLADKMQKLEMTEMATAVLKRARRNAGKQENSLYQLMTKFERQNLEVAAEIAMQIMNKTRNSNSQQHSNLEHYQRQAANILKKANRLEPLIKQTEKQLANSPKSVDLMKKLAVFYGMTNQTKKAKELSERLIKAVPQTPATLAREAQQAANRQEYDRSIKLFKRVFELDPSAAQNYLYQMGRAYRETNRQEEFVEILEKTDLKKYFQFYTIENAFYQLRDRQNPERGEKYLLRVVDKMWQTYPEARLRILGSFEQQTRDSDIWKSKKLKDYIRQAYLPEKPTPNLWAEFGSGGSYSHDSEGRILTLTNKMFDVYGTKELAGPFIADLEERIEKHANWWAGKALLAVMYIKREQPENAKPLLAELMESRTNMQDVSKQLLAQYLAESSDFKELAIQLYQQLVDHPQHQNQNEFRYRPAKQLVRLYQAEKQTDKAIDLLVAEMNRLPQYNGGNLEHQASQQIRHLESIGKEFQLIENHFAAFILYQKICSNTLLLDQAKRYLGSSYEKRLVESKNLALSKLTAENVQATLDLGVLEKMQARKSKKNSFQPLASMILETDISYVDGLEIKNSFLDELTAKQESKTESSANKELKNTQTEMKAQTQEEKQAVLQQVRAILLERLKVDLDENPDNVPTLVAHLVLGGLEGQAEYDSAKLAQLKSFLSIVIKEAKITRNQKVKSSLTIQQRKQMLLSLWLVTRASWSQPESTEFGDGLSESVLETARALERTDWLIGMLKERGEQHIKRGNKAAAEKDWREVLQLLLATTKGKRAIPAQSNNVVLSSNTGSTVAVRSQASTTNGAATQKSETKKLTEANFLSVMELSKLAAENGMLEFSIEAVQKSLANGLPRYTRSTNRNNQNLYPDWSVQETFQYKSEAFVERELRALEKVWRKQGVPLEQVFELYWQVVFPKSNPDQINLCQYLYLGEERLQSSSLALLPAFQLKEKASGNSSEEGEKTADHLPAESMEEAQSIARMMISLAVELKKEADLETRLTEKLANEKLVLPVRTLLAELAFRTADFSKGEQQLQEILTLLKQDRNRVRAAEVCRVTLPVLDLDEVSSTAFQVYEQGLENLTRGNRMEPATSAFLLLAEKQLEQGDQPASAKTMKQFMDYHKKIRQQGGYRNVSGQQSQQIKKLLDVVVHHADLDSGLEFMGVVYDSLQGRSIGINSIMASINLRLQQLSAQERFEKLSRWIFPKDNVGPAAREQTLFIPTDLPPERFTPSESDGTEKAKGNVERLATRKGIFSTSLMFVEAAKETGQLDNLAAQVAALNITDPETKFSTELFIKHTQDDLEATKKAYAELKQILVPQMENDSTIVTPAKILIGLIGLERPELEEDAFEILKAYNDKIYRKLRTYIRSDLTRTNAVMWEYFLRQQPAYQRETQTALPYWDATSHVNKDTELIGTVDSVWFGQNGHIKHQVGPNEDHLYFAYPIEGEYEFSFETLNERWSEGHLTHGGVTYQIEGMSRGEIWGMGRQGSAILQAPSLKRSQFNEFKIKVSPGNVKMFLNGELFVEDKNPSQANPWIGLFSEDAVRSYFRNIKLSGNITVPEKISLLDGEGLRGWVGTFLNERVEENVSYLGTDSHSRNLDMKTAWLNKNGVLHGVGNSGQDAYEPQQSYLYYHRPLRNKDRVSYEFYYEPGKTEVHPTFGRLAFLLNPNEVKLHWIVGEDRYHWTGLTGTNAISLKEGEQLVEKLELKAAAWNKMELIYENNMISLILNDTKIVEVANDLEGLQNFGFFHYKNQSESRVRNVVLTGDWPTDLSAEQALAMMTMYGTKLNSNSTGETKITASLVPEEIVSDHTQSFLANVRKQKTEQQVKQLEEWVMPNVEHDTFRLYPAADNFVKGANPTEPGVVQYLDAPVFDLLKLTNESNQLQAIIEEAKTVPLETNEQKLTQTGFLILAALQLEQEQEVRLLLAQFQSQLEAVSDPELFWNRWPELLVCHRLKQAGKYQAELERLMKTINKLPVPVEQRHFPGMRNPTRWREAWKFVTEEASSTAKGKPEPKVKPQNNKKRAAAREKRTIVDSAF